MAKNGNGEGGITRHKKSGLYMARYTVETPTGKKRKTALRQDAIGGPREAHRGALEPKQGANLRG